MLQMLISLSALFLSFSLLCLGHGLQNTLIGVRAALENFPDSLIGLMMSGYFAGFLLSTWTAPKLINRVGQIRTFAAAASLFSSTSLLHVLFVEPYSWIFFRLLHGFSMGMLYVVIESWLNALSTRSNRGRILSVYMIINFLCLALGQLFMVGIDPTEFTLFAIASVLTSFSLLPLLLSTRSRQPGLQSANLLKVKQLYKISPLATIGSIITGICSGAFWGMGPVYFTKIGMVPANIAWFIMLSFMGGLLLQWPIGYFSDRAGRRIAIACASAISVATSLAMIFFSGFETSERLYYLLPLAVLFGGFYYPLYSLVIALANDHLESDQFTQASATLLFLQGGGAIAGPVLATLMIALFGNSGLFLLLAGLFGCMLAFSVTRIVIGTPICETTTEQFVPLPRTATGITSFDPRTEFAESA